MTLRVFLAVPSHRQEPSRESARGGSTRRRPRGCPAWSPTTRTLYHRPATSHPPSHRRRRSRPPAIRRHPPTPHPPTPHPPTPYPSMPRPPTSRPPTSRAAVLPPPGPRVPARSRTPPQVLGLRPAQVLVLRPAPPRVLITRPPSRRSPAMTGRLAMLPRAPTSGRSPPSRSRPLIRGCPISSRYSPGMIARRSPVRAGCRTATRRVLVTLRVPVTRRVPVIRRPAMTRRPAASRTFCWSTP